MQVAKPVGRDAASRKYDILSALMVFALSQDKTTQRQVMRLTSLITTRYNWQRDELSMGQEDIARLWSVDARTVKRELAKLRAKGWVITKRQGARGRVSVYGLDLSLILVDTRPVWPQIGADFVERMSPGSSTEKAPTNVVPLRQAPPVPNKSGSLWSQVQRQLHQIDATTYGAWFHSLQEIDCREGRLLLAAPSKFHATYVEGHLKQRLLAVVRRCDPTIHDVRLES